MRLMMRWRSLASPPSGTEKLETSGVSTPPGATALTRTPRPAYSTARALVKSTTPPLDAQYAADQGEPISPAFEATLTMLPSLASSMWGRVALAMRNVPVRFTARIFCHRSRGMSAVWEKAPMPATLHRTLGRPRAAVAWPRCRSPPPRRTRRSGRPPPSRRPTRSRPPSPSGAPSTTSRQATAPPSAAMRTAVARPMPELAPVTMAVRPSKRPRQRAVVLGAHDDLLVSVHSCRCRCRCREWWEERAGRPRPDPGPRTRWPSGGRR
jgi:hypothetical protein